MRLGITPPHSVKSATKENILKVVQYAINAGIDSLWTFERMLWALKFQTSFPASLNGHLPVKYPVIYYPLQTLGIASATSSTIQIRHCILQFLFYNVVILAKSLATLDILLSDRLITGFELGLMKDEFQVSKGSFQNRGKRYDEMIELVKKMWLHNIVNFSEIYYNIPPSQRGPKSLLIIKFDANWYLGAAVGQRHTIENTMKTIISNALEDGNNSDNYSIIVLSYSQIVEEGFDDKYRHHVKRQRQLIQGTINQIGDDIKYVNSSGIDHLTKGLTLGHESKDFDNNIELAK